VHLPSTKDKDNSLASYFLKKAARLQSGYKNASHKVTSTVIPKHIYEITKIKLSDPDCQYMLWRRSASPSWGLHNPWISKLDMSSYERLWKAGFFISFSLTAKITTLEEQR
jgi:hypothetical protein